jgi:GT2 family glycosyltransferase
MISYITPTLWERPKYLSEAENSLFNQIYKDIEWIIISDKKKPDTINLTNKIKTKIIIDQNLNYISKKRNEGIKQAQGEYIAFLDDDNLKLHEFGSTMIENIKDNSNAIFCFAKILKDKYDLMDIHHISTVDYNEAWVIGGFYFTEEMFIKKSFLEEIGMFDENMIFSEDYDLAFNIMQHTKVKLIPKYLSMIRQHDSQLSNSNVVPDTQRCLRLFLKKHNKIDDKCFFCKKDISNIEYPYVKIVYLEGWKILCIDCNNKISNKK